MNELRYIFYGSMLIIACILVCDSFMNLYLNAKNIKKIAENGYGQQKVDMGSCILLGIGAAYIIWFILINPLKYIQLW